MASLRQGLLLLLFLIAVAVAASLIAGRSDGDDN